jgi:hypothetical protein
MDYYLAIKKNEIISFSGKWMELEIIMLSQINQTQKDKYHVFTHMQNLDLKKVIIWHDCKSGSAYVGQLVERGKKEEDGWVSIIEVHFICV